MEIEILKPGSDQVIVTLKNVAPSTTIGDVKKLIHKQKRSLYPERQSLRLDGRGKSVEDEAILKSLTLKNDRSLYLKDLGPQIGWKTVFFWEYFGPVLCYLIEYSRPSLLYGDRASEPMHQVVHIAAACWTFHYGKRILETFFVHRFSHSTMPIRNLLKNCTYYWGFAAIIGYYVNHPLYTSPYFGAAQVYLSAIGFIISELGNLSIHLALRNLRPDGSKERKIPRPTSNPFTQLFNFVSCPNYSYEFYAWGFFSLMTQCLPAAAFTAAGFLQMAIWAQGKHRQYKKEFPNYPRSRKAIIPFIF